MLFLAGFVDSIAGGGGLISLPAYLFTGLPIHTAIATNKFSSTFGTALATVRFIGEKLVLLRLAVPSVVCGFIGSACGAKLSLLVSDHVLKFLLLLVLPLAAFCVLNRRFFKEKPHSEIIADRRTIIVVTVSALLVGVYDGLYGPGTGTFLIIAFIVVGRMSVARANAHTKVINLSTNIAALNSSWNCRSFKQYGGELHRLRTCDDERLENRKTPRHFGTSPAFSEDYCWFLRASFSSRFFIRFETTSAQDASPVMFRVVRPMSKMRSTPTTSAMPSTGSPAEVRIKASITTPAPGTPAVPTDASVAVNTMEIICAKVRSIP